MIGCGGTRRIGAHRGAPKMRNSRRPKLAVMAYGRLPYAWIENEQADDFWSPVDAGFGHAKPFK